MRNMKKDKTHNIIFYCLTAVTAVLLTYWFNNTSDHMLKILLYPQARAVEIFYHTSLVYISGIGYSVLDGTFVIGPGCLGVKFIIILFAMTACMFTQYFKGIYKGLWFITSLMAAVLGGIIISCIRIIGSIPFVNHPKFALLHAGIGISLYFFVLMMCYGALNKLVRGDNCAEDI